MKKSRKVVITLEVDTDLTLKQLKDSYLINVAIPDQGGHVIVRQVQANVVKAPK